MDRIAAYQAQLEELKALRNSQDQIMRTKTIHIRYGPTTSDMTETRRFLEAEIERLESEIQFLVAELLDQE